MFRMATITAMLAAVCLRADPPDAKLLTLRDYLPTLLLKTQFETAHEYAASLETLHKLAQSLNDAGFVSATQARQVERELLQTRIDALKREREHLDSLDQFQAKLDVKPERIRQLEDQAIVPLRQQLRKFEDICGDLDSLAKEISKYDDPDSVHKLRASLGRIISTAAGFRDTRFRADFALRWNYWHKQSDKEIGQLLQDKLEERRKLLADKTAVEDKGQQLSAEGQHLLALAELELDLGRFEMALRRYEREPWKDREDAAQRQADSFRVVAVAFGAVVLRGYAERFDQLRASWPQIAPFMFEKADLLGGDREQAERVVAAALKSPEAVAATKAKLRKLRSLADTYRMGQRLVEMALVQRQNDLDALRSPTVSANNPTNSDPSNPLAQVLASEKEVWREKSQIYRTWIEIQITRLDLENDLGVTAP